MVGERQTENNLQAWPALTEKEIPVFLLVLQRMGSFLG